MKKLVVAILIAILFISLYSKSRDSKNTTPNNESQESVQSEKKVTKTPVTIKVKKGEGLWQIAQREMGDGHKWVELADTNNIKKPYILHIDQELKIPGKEIETVVDTSITYTLAQIAEHSDKNSCWFAIDGKVYDVTPYISSGFHPGKAAILQGCGKDATTLFNTRPMGSGTSHSERARKLLPKYLIGNLEN